MDKEAEVGQTIWLKVEICKIKRDPKCPNNAPIAERFAYYEKVRVVCRELVSIGEYSNAADLYARCAQNLRSIPKLKLEKLSEEDQRLRTTALTTLYTNLAHCMIKKKLPEKAVKAAQNAVDADQTNFKAFYRLAQAYQDLHDFDQSSENFKKAISLQPQDRQLREEYKKMIDYKNAKIKEWNSKMFGFFDKANVQEQIKQDEREATLRQKIARQTFGEGAGNYSRGNVVAAAEKDIWSQVPQ